MRKNFGSKTWLFPMPVLIIGTYGEDGTPDAMNAAWGGIGDDNQIFICLSPEHKTVKNILAKKAFTVSVADAAHVVECDYVGIASGNDTPDKIQKSGLHAVKAPTVDAPYFEELAFALECTLISYDEKSCHLFGKIVNASIDEKILTDGKIDVKKLKPITFDCVSHDYIALGETVGKAFSDGLKLKS